MLDLVLSINHNLESGTGCRIMLIFCSQYTYSVCHLVFLKKKNNNNNNNNSLLGIGEHGKDNKLNIIFMNENQHVFLGVGVPLERKGIKLFVLFCFL